MPNTRSAKAVRLAFGPGSMVQTNAEQLTKVTLDRSRRLLACLPIASDARGEPCLVRRAKDGRRALRLKGDAQTNLLTRALTDDPHFGRFMTIPGKDNGFDIEGLAVDGRRLLLGLRGPVLRGWSAVLEIAVEAHGTCTSADRMEGEHTVLGELLRHGRVRRGPSGPTGLRRAPRR